MEWLSNKINKILESPILPSLLGFVLVIALVMTACGWCLWSIKWVLSLLFGI